MDCGIPGLAAARALSLVTVLWLSFCSGASEVAPPVTEGLATGQKAGATQDLRQIRGLLLDGRYTEAETAARALLREVESTRGPGSLQTAEVLDLLVEARWRAGKSNEPGTRALAERAIEIKEKTLGPDHPELAASLNNLGRVLDLTGDLAGAKQLHQRALSIQEKALGHEDIKLAWSLSYLGILLYETGDYSGARQLHERALALRERALGPEHRDVAWSLNNLAVIEHDSGDYAGAKALYERSLVIREKVLGPDHPEVAGSLNNLAAVLSDMGDYAGARRLFERAVAIREKALGPEHPSLGSTVGNLAFLLWRLGDYDGAKPLFERALKIYEKSVGPEHPEVAYWLQSLADLLNETGDHARARELHERALAIRERVLGPDHPDVAASLNSLANLLRESGDTDRASPLYERALAMQEKALGPEHPDVARTLDNLAGLLRDTGEYARARPLYERALAIREKTLGPAHPDVARSLNNLAELLLDTGQSAEALERALRAETIGTDHLRLTARALAERQALSYASVRATSLDLALSLIVENPIPSGPGRVWDALIRSRALVLDEMAARHRDVMQITRLARELASARERLANLVVRGPGKDTPEGYRALLDEARRRKERAEMALAESSSVFRQELASQQIGLHEVAQNLPAGSALVAFVLYDRHGRSGGGRKTHPIPSYLGFVLTGRETPAALVPLGAAGEIDGLVSRWKEEAARGPVRADRSPGEAEAACRGTGEALRRVIWDPLASRLAGAKRVFVVPDGALHLVNFYALPVGEGEYQVEAGPLIHYLSAERDLIADGKERARGEGLLALGGPAFDEPRLFAALNSGGEKPKLAGRASVANVRPYRGEHSLCNDFRSIRFASLPASVKETEEIVSLWNRSMAASARERVRPEATGGEGTAPDVAHLTGAGANEAAFKDKAPGRRVLHLATHGFFLGGRCRSSLEPARGVGGLTPEPEPALAPGENPLLLAGLALAGANHRDAAGADEEDGILTAEEIAAMDLSGVEWAVLSACDTGIGEVKAGEGVFGLRRAFQMAGAGTVIMSLWSVEDEVARQWMRALYEARLVRNLGTAEAVREAGLKVLRQQRANGKSGHPFYWASFVAAGEWR